MGCTGMGCRRNEQIVGNLRVRHRTACGVHYPFSQSAFELVRDLRARLYSMVENCHRSERLGGKERTTTNKAKTVAGSGRRS